MEPYVATSTAAQAITLSIGLLVARLVLGLYIAAHGAQKLLGWFGGYGLAGTSGFFEQIGFRPGRVFAITASVAEIVSGVLLVLGLFGPVGPALMISVLIVAAISVHWPNGMFAMSNGIELTVVFAAGAFVLALTGPGQFSLDVLFGLQSLWRPDVAALALALGVAGGVANLAVRRPPRVSTTS